MAKTKMKGGFPMIAKKNQFNFDPKASYNGFPNPENVGLGAFARATRLVL